MIIEKANIKDIEGCLELLKETNEDHFTEEMFNKAILDSNVLFFVAKENKNVIGYVIGFVNPCYQKHAVLQETRVSIKHRRKGIAIVLIEQFLDELKLRNVDEVGAVVDKEDEVGVSLYKKAKFIKLDQWKWYSFKIEQ
jgi:ribosomal protein S18 acetylase RimI-like enzyme